MIKKSVLFFIIAFFCSFYSCIEKEPRLNRSHNKIIDSLVNKQKPVIRENLDSICDILFAKKVNRMTDSIVQDRMNEIKRKIEIDAKEN